MNMSKNRYLLSELSEFLERLRDCDVWAEDDVVHLRPQVGNYEDRVMLADGFDALLRALRDSEREEA